MLKSYMNIISIPESSFMTFTLFAISVPRFFLFDVKKESELGNCGFKITFRLFIKL